MRMLKYIASCCLQNVPKTIFAMKASFTVLNND